MTNMSEFPNLCVNLVTNCIFIGSIFNGLQGMVLVLVVAMVLAFVNYSNTASYKHHLSRCLQGLSHGKTMNKERLAQSLQGSLQPLKVLRNSKTHIMEKYVCYAIKLKL